MRTRATRMAALTTLALLVAACSDDGSTTAGTDADRPTVVVTTSTLADVVQQVSGDQVDVVTIMPPGADPHDFQASAQQVNAIREADALVVNGADLEESLLDLLAAAESDGVPTHEAISPVETIAFGATQEGELGGDGEPAGAGTEPDPVVDPHFFQDPSRVAVAAAGIGDFLAEVVEGIDDAAMQAGVDAYVAELEALDDEVEALLAEVPEERRVLVTNHDAFGYFADRYGFEIVGTVVPSGSTTDGAAAGDLARLAQLVRDEGVPAIFAENVASDSLAQALADEVGGEVEVVELFTDSLGEGAAAGSYVEMVRTNAQRIAAALA